MTLVAPHTCNTLFTPDTALDLLLKPYDVKLDFRNHRRHCQWPVQIELNGEEEGVVVRGKAR